jgi:hypothetical protein
MAVGDGLESLTSWGVALMFAICALASWLLRPADRRLPQTRLPRDRIADVGQDEAHLSRTRPREWAVATGLLGVLYATSFLTLPAVEDFMHQNATELGWIAERAASTGSATCSRHAASPGRSPATASRTEAARMKTVDIGLA